MFKVQRDIRQNVADFWRLERRSSRVTVMQLHKDLYSSAFVNLTNAA
jgi:hypothetical protein